MITLEFIRIRLSQPNTTKVPSLDTLYSLQIKCHAIHWILNKSKTSTWSGFDSEVMFFADAFDIEFTLKYDLEFMSNVKNFLSLITDGLSLFDLLTRSRPMTEKRRLINDFRTVQDVLQFFEVNDVVLIRSKINIADGLTKMKENSEIMDELKTGNILI